MGRSGFLLVSSVRSPGSSQLLPHRRMMADQPRRATAGPTGGGERSFWSPPNGTGASVSRHSCHPHALQLPFALSQAAGPAQAMKHQFGDDSLHQAALAVESPELSSVLSLSLGLQVGLIRMLPAPSRTEVSLAHGVSGMGIAAQRRYFRRFYVGGVPATLPVTGGFPSRWNACW